MRSPSVTTITSTFGFGRFRKSVLMGVASRVRNKQAARSAIAVTELLARQRDCWRVNNWRHFLDVIEKKRVEEYLVRVLQSSQVNVPLEVVVFSLVSLVSTYDLLVECLYVRRKKTEQTKKCALFLGESCAFIQQRCIEQIHPARNPRRDGFGDTLYDRLRHVLLPKKPR